MPHALATIIDAAFEDRANITPKTSGDVRQAVEVGAASARRRQGAGGGEDRRRRPGRRRGRSING